jgi:glycosyltransferase involved in cell wall biosynthesis
MKKPLVSILMPTMNSASYIRETLNSLVDQTYPNIELIIADAASTDDTLTIIEEFRDGVNNDITIVHCGSGNGMGHDLNKGLSACNGAFIARMDADDIAMNWRIEGQYHFLSRLPEVDLVGTGAELFGGASGVQRSPEWDDHIRDMYLVNNPFFHPTIMFRRKLVDNGMYKYDPAFKADEDYELWGRLLPEIVAANMQDVLLRYRIHESNGQREPWKQRHKLMALERFTKAQNVYSAELVEVLSEYQCSNFITPEMFEILCDYAHKSRDKDAVLGARDRWPKLGWLQWAFLEYPRYPDFMLWYFQAKGWRGE